MPNPLLDVFRNWRAQREAGGRPLMDRWIAQGTLGQPQDRPFLQAVRDRRQAQGLATPILDRARLSADQPAFQVPPRNRPFLEAIRTRRQGRGLQTPFLDRVLGQMQTAPPASQPTAQPSMPVTLPYTPLPQPVQAAPTIQQPPAPQPAAAGSAIPPVPPLIQAVAGPGAIDRALAPENIPYFQQTRPIQGFDTLLRSWGLMPQGPMVSPQMQEQLRRARALGAGGA